MQGFEPQQPNLPWPANNSRNEGGPAAPSGVGKGNLERSTSYHSDRSSGRDRVFFFCTSKIYIVCNVFVKAYNSFDF